MSATSPNGWPVSPNPEDLNITPMKVGSGGVPFSPGVRGGRVHQVLTYVANAVHTRVQHASSSYGCWGYSFRENVNSPGEWSNHASGTAIDFNATRHPNGQSTSENWTPAQIAEIHAILAEVGGAVRWGGDYEGTPDAMHFEIDVTPAELEAMDLPAAVASVAIGSPEIAKATEIAPMSVSYPTMAAYTPNGAYWKFTATQTGRVSIDALLSHYVDPEVEANSPQGPYVQVALYRPIQRTNYIEYQSIPGGTTSYYNIIQAPGFPQFPNGATYREQGRVLLPVQAGETYFIRAYADGGFPYIRTVVRISDYAEQPEWVQPPDQERTWAYANGSFGTAVTEPHVGGVLANGGGFMGGEMEAWRSFGGPTPGSQIDAINCLWHWSRRFYLNTEFWWSAGNGGEWSGGTATCPNWNGQIDRNSTHGGTAVGHWYSSDEYSMGFFYYQEVRFRTYGSSYVLNPAAIPTYEKRNGQAKAQDTQATYLPSIMQTEILEWESPASTLVDLDYAWDERAGSNDHSPYPLTVKWYAGDYSEPRNPGEWGPNPDSSTWYGQGMDTPENWAGSQEHLGDTTNGATTWRQLDPDRWADGSTAKTRFTALPAELLSDNLPNYGGISLVSNELYRENYKSGCYIALKSVVRPSRYRIHPDPGIPDLPWAGVNAISISLKETGQVLY